MTLAKDCGGVEIFPMATVAGTRAADWTEVRGMESLAGDVGGSIVTRYFNSLGEIERLGCWKSLRVYYIEQLAEKALLRQYTRYRFKGKSYLGLVLVRVPHLSIACIHTTSGTC
jgi:hypothetical protein